MTVALKHVAKRSLASIAAFCMSAALLSGALQSNQHEANALPTAAPTHVEPTAALHVWACAALLAVIHAVDWRAVRFLFNCVRDLEQEPSPLFGRR